MKNTVGRSPWADSRIRYYVQRFGIKAPDRRHPRILTQALLDQLDACKCDCARRLILGVSEQFAESDMKGAA